MVGPTMIIQSRPAHTTRYDRSKMRVLPCHFRRLLTAGTHTETAWAGQMSLRSSLSLSIPVHPCPFLSVPVSGQWGGLSSY